MTESDLATIRTVLGRSRQRVKVVDVAAGRVVVKRQRPRRGAWRERTLGVLARALGLPLLQPAPARGGAAAQATEAARLRTLAAAGVRVPELLHVDPGFLVLEHLAGPSLVRLIEEGGPAAFDAWQRGLAALADVHRRGGHLSHAFARNFIVTETGLATIDFEDDPLEVMALAEAQARDWLAYLHSTVWQLEREPAETGAALARHLAAAPVQVGDRVRAALARLAVLRHLPRSRRALGRELAGAQALGRLAPLPVASPGG